MQMTRRAVAIGAAAAAAALLPGKPSAQQAAAVIRKPIPSSGETIPVIGLGTARRYQEVGSDADLMPLRDTLRRFKEVGATVIDTAPVYGAAEDSGIQTGQGYHAIKLFPQNGARASRRVKPQECANASVGEKGRAAHSSPPESRRQPSVGISPRSAACAGA